MFNDVILRVGFESALPIIDLRLACGDPGGYANPIAPSVQGGARMARAILRVADRRGTGHDPLRGLIQPRRPRPGRANRPRPFRA